MASSDQTSPEESDHELARQLQEQEAAMYQFFNQRDGPGYFELGQLEPMMGVEESSDGAADEEQAAGGPQWGEEEDSQWGEEDGGGDEPALSETSSSNASQIDDEEFARRLQIQEQRQHQRRLMEMAGIGGELEELSEDDEEDEDRDEEDSYLTDDSIDPDGMTYEELRALTDTVGVVSRGLTADVIAKLPEAFYMHPSENKIEPNLVKEAVHWGCDNDEQCAVCRMEFETGNKVKQLPCKHVFHPGCIDQWLVINKACPICGNEVNSKGCGCGEQEASHGREQLPKLS